VSSVKESNQRHPGSSVVNWSSGIVRQQVSSGIRVISQQVLSELSSVIYEAGLRRQRSDNVVLRSRQSVRRSRRGNAVNRSARGRTVRVK